jgi:photosystem II stability/assembly factor-like uncharacterized protein
MIVANSDHQRAAPFDDRDRLPEELRQVAQRYAMLPVPRPTPEETSELIARLQASASPEPSSLPAHRGEVAREVGRVRSDSPDLSPLRMPPQQRGRRVMHPLEALAAVLVAVVVVGSFLLVLTLRLHHAPAPSSRVTDQPVTFQMLRMFDATNGWATTFDGVHVLHTRKGVRHWQNVTPQRFAQSHSQGPLEAADFMDALQAWVVFSPSPTASSSSSPPQLVVAGTSDGGQTWQETTIVPHTSAFARQITFLTPQLGWLLLSEGAALGSEGVEVLRTTDGGATWQTVTRTSKTTPNRPGSLPFTGVKSGISFISPTTGWITGMMEGLYQTQDGGTTWYRQSLPLPDTLPPATQAYLAGTGPLLTFDGGAGIFPVELGLSDGRVIPELYRTNDGGQTWLAAGTLPAWPAAITFLNRQEGWAARVQQHKLLLSYAIFGGVYTWKTYSEAVPPSVTRITDLNFAANGTTGWIIGETNEGQSTLLLQTTDSGQTWREVQPLLEAVAPSPEGTAGT